MSHHVQLPVERFYCTHCALHKMGQLAGLTTKEVEKFNSGIYTQRAIKSRQVIYLANTLFEEIYAIKSGSVKTAICDSNGREQITGFWMVGELLGFDGIGAKKYQCNAISLEHSQLCFIYFHYLQNVCREFPVIQNYIHEMMSDEIVRGYNLNILLGNMQAEERLALFLLNLSQRLRLHGYSPWNFHLRMTREEIGNHLGMRLETVSRTFSKLQAQGIIKVQKKDVTIINKTALECIMQR